MRLLAKLFDVLGEAGKNLGRQVASSVGKAYSGWQNKRETAGQTDDTTDFDLTDAEYVEQLAESTSEYYLQASEELEIERQENEAHFKEFSQKLETLTEQVKQDDVTIDDYKTEFSDHQGQLSSMMSAASNQATTQHQQLEQNINEMSDDFDRVSGKK